MMRIHLCLAMVCLATVSAAQAAVFNGAFLDDRVFNGFPDSDLTVTDNFPSIIEFNDQNMNVSQQTGFANRHDAIMSTDGGVTPTLLPITEGFSVGATVMLDAVSNTPRKEAGIRINSPITGDALFLINSDAGEIVAFGGGAPFFLFGNNGGGNGYTPGTEIYMGVKYTPGAPGTIEYMIDRGMGLETSGPLPWANIEGGPVNYRVAFYVQGGSNTEGDGMIGRFTNFVPEPSSFALLGLAAGLLGLVGWRRAR